MPTSQFNGLLTLPTEFVFPSQAAEGVHLQSLSQPTTRLKTLGLYFIGLFPHPLARCRRGDLYGMPVNVIAFITVRNHRSAFNTEENLQAVISRGVIFKHGGGVPPLKIIYATVAPRICVTLATGWMVAQ